MAKIDQTFQELCNEILTNGREYENVNRGVKRLQIPSYTLRHSFSDGFPAITNKKLYWKGIVTELIWFLRGDTNVRYLNDNGVKIWNKDAWNWHKKAGGKMTFEQFDTVGGGSVGANYSKQWRDFCGVDQIKRLIEDMEKDIMSSRLKVNAWNPAEIFDTALPPCHSEFQVVGVPLTSQERRSLSNFSDEDWNDIVEKGLEMEALEGIVPEFGFELHWNQRSVDTFLGLPFNIASYGLLAKILEEVTGFVALGIEGTLKCVHFYDNQYDAVKELLKRDPNTHGNCEISINSLQALFVENSFENFMENITDWKPSDFKLVGYTSDEEIKVEMLAPKE
jgi:thymidylate synthase